MKGFTPEELAEMAAFDAEVDAEPLSMAEIAESRARDREAVLESMDKRARARAAYHKAYYEANKEAIADYKKAYYEANKEAIADYHKAYYEANKEARAAYHKAYYEANKEAIADYQKAYREANKEAIRRKHTLYMRKYRARKREEAARCREDLSGSCATLTGE